MNLTRKETTKAPTRKLVRISSYAFLVRVNLGLDRMSFKIPHGHPPVLTFDFIDVIQNAQKITEISGKQ